MIGEVTRRGGLPSLPDRVIRPAGVAFCHVNTWRWGNQPTTCQELTPKANLNNMAALRYERGEFFRGIYLPILEQSNQEGEEQGDKKRPSESKLRVKA